MMTMVREEEEGKLLFCEKKARVVPPPDEIAKSWEKGAHHPFSPTAPAGARRWQSGPEVGGRPGKPIAQLQPPW